MNYLITIFFIFIPVICLSQSSITNSVEVESILKTIENNYAPLQWKSETIGLNWETTKNHYSKRLLESQDMYDFYSSIADLLGSFQDAHVGFSFPSNYSRRLPFQVSYAEGKTIVNYIDEDLVKNTNCPLSVGDELIELDGLTPAEIREIFKNQHGVGIERTDNSLLSTYITTRHESIGFFRSGDERPTASISFLRNNNSQILYCSIPWKVKGMPIINRSTQPRYHIPEVSLMGNEGLFTKKLLKRYDQVNNLINLTTPIFQSDIFSVIGKDDSGKGKKTVLGAKKPFFELPENFKKIKVNLLAKPLVMASGLYAGTFKYKGKRVGFLRIPSYMPPVFELSLFGLRIVISELEKKSDFLIIDQTNNPGGSIIFCDWIVFSLTGLYNVENHIKFLIKPEERFLRTFANIVSELEDEPEIEAEWLKKLRAKYISELKENFSIIKYAYMNNQYLSAPVDFSSISRYYEEYISHIGDIILSEYDPKWKELYPMLTKLIGVDIFKRQVYTKKVFFLINELDFSGGDATPAILKDYGRVTTVGVNTAGAGGSVMGFMNNVRNSFQYSLTNSLIYRKNGVYIENVGVKPNISFESTVDDYRNEHKEYFSRLLDTLIK